MLSRLIDDIICEEKDIQDKNEQLIFKAGEMLWKSTESIELPTCIRVIR